jgi:replication factor C subunit 2/4
MFGADMLHERVLELNASDERGINVIRTKVKKFAQLAVSSTSSRVPPFKIIILDEADNMTGEAQAALRRTMEEYSKVTRFCLICNYVSRIIDPIASRCAKFRFKPLSHETLTQRVQTVATNEGIQLSPNTLDTIMQVSRGDLRKAITTLQSAHRMFGSSSSPLTSAQVEYVAGTVPTDRLEPLIRTMSSKHHNVDNIANALDILISDGFSGIQILRQLHDGIISGQLFPNASDESLSAVLITLSEKEKLMGDGSNEYLQLLDLASKSARAIAGRV